MKLLHNAKLSVFCKPEDNYESTKNAFVSLAGINLKKEKIKINEFKTKGFNERIIQSIELTLNRNRHVRLFMDHLKSLLNDTQKKTLVSQIPSRLDNELFFFIRLDKKSWATKRRLILTDSGSCFHIRLSVAAFPKRKNIAAGIVKMLFSQSEPPKT